MRKKGREKKKEKEVRMTGNGIRVEGAKSMSEMLKVNSTLTSLDLGSEEERKREKERKRSKNDRQ